jgi:hypothetical protein
MMNLTLITISFSILAFHLCVMFWWLSNAAILHSAWGIVLWILSPILGYVLYKRNPPSTLGKILYLSCVIVIILGILAGLITLITSSMP